MRQVSRRGFSTFFSRAVALELMLPVDSIGQTCFPFVLGLMRDRYANYHAGLILVSALALAGAIAIAFLPARSTQVRRPETVGAASQ